MKVTITSVNLLMIYVRGRSGRRTAGTHSEDVTRNKDDTIVSISLWFSQSTQGLALSYPGQDVGTKRHVQGSATHGPLLCSPAAL